MLLHGRFTRKVINKRRWRDHFDVVRSETVVNDKGRGETTEQIIHAFGCIQAAQDEYLERLPEGDRNAETISIHTGTTLTAGTGNTQADIIEWEGERYLVRVAKDQRQYGFCHALATIMKVRARDV